MQPQSIAFPYLGVARQCTSLESKIDFAKKTIVWAADRFGSQFAMSTSFGIQSALLLHLASQAAPNVPVVFIDTGYLFPETYQYAIKLSDIFHLNIKTYQSRVSVAHMEAIYGRMWEDEDPEKRRLYGLLRKVIPMKQAKKELNTSCLMAGLRGGQTDHRAGLDTFEYDAADNCYKLYPLLFWSKADVEDYFSAFQLPRHPLHYQGFTTVGDKHSSRPRSQADVSDRDTRFGPTSQQECGLHTEKLSLEEYEDYVYSALKYSRKVGGFLPPENSSSMGYDDMDGFVIYGKPSCRFCRAAKLLLSERRISFRERYIVTLLKRSVDSIPSNVNTVKRETEADSLGSDCDWCANIEDDGPGEQDVAEVTFDPSLVPEVTFDWLTRRLRVATNDRLFTFSTVPQVLLDGQHVGGYMELCTYLNVIPSDGERLLNCVQQDITNNTNSTEIS